MKLKQLGVLGLVLVSMLGTIGCTTQETTKDKSTVEVVKEQEKKEEPKEEKEEVKPEIKEQVMYDENNLKVTYTGEVIGTYAGGIELKFLLENNREEAIMFASEKSAINGFMGGLGIAKTVEPGKKAYVNYWVTGSGLKELGITREQVTEIEFSLWFYDSDNWNGFSVKTDTYKINTVITN